MRTDWLPAKRAEQLYMAKNWRKLMNENRGKWSLPNAESQFSGDFDALITNADEALAQAVSSDRTPSSTARCKAAFDAMTAKMRFIKDRYFKMPPLNEGDLSDLGLKPPDTVKTPVPAPAGQASADITYPGPHLLMLHLKPLAGTLLDPRADHGYRIYYGVLPPGGASAEEAASSHRYLMKAAVEGTELPESLFTRRRKETMDFPAADSGKTAYFCIRYENAKGQKGPWGPLFSAVIP